MRRKLFIHYGADPKFLELDEGFTIDSRTRAEKHIVDPYNTSFYIYLSRSIDSKVQKSIIYLYPELYNIVENDGKIEICTFISMLKCFKKNFRCKSKWRQENDIYIADLLFCNLITEDTDENGFAKVGNLYLDSKLKYGKIKIIANKFSTIKDYFNWEFVKIDGGRHVYSSKYFTVCTSILYTNFLKKIDRFGLDNIIAIASSSNHQESQHKTFNTHAHAYKLEKRLLQIFEDIKDRIFNFKLQPHRNAKNKLFKLSIQAENIPTALKSSSCDCFDSKYYKALYELNQFPCIHTIHESDLLITAKKFGNGAIKNNRYQIKDPLPAEINMKSNDSKFFHDSTALPWSTDNVENPRKPPINYKTKDVPTKDMCALGQNIILSENHKDFKRFYYFTLNMLKNYEKIPEDKANLILIERLLKLEFKGMKNDEFYFKLTIDVLSGSMEITQSSIDEIFEKYQSFEANHKIANV